MGGGAGEAAGLAQKASQGQFDPAEVNRAISHHSDRIGYWGGASLGEEIGKAGKVVEVEGAFGTTDWSFADQARYAYYLSTRDQDQTVIADMHRITDDQAYGLGQLGIPFKGGWSDVDEDGSWHTRQFGWREGTGIAIGARSAAGSYDDTMDALDKVAEAIDAGTDPRADATAAR